jgi:hypothetical protein
MFEVCCFKNISNSSEIERKYFLHHKYILPELQIKKFILSKATLYLFLRAGLFLARNDVFLKKT